MEAAGPEGLSQQELGHRLGQGKLEARTICRNLDRRGLVVKIMKDIGRQRVTNFVAKKFETVSQGAVQYQVEKEKNDQVILSSDWSIFSILSSYWSIILILLCH